MSFNPNPYKTYQALLTQTSTNAPVATVYTNGMGATMTWAYVSPGIYTVTAGSAVFTANKTIVIIGQPLATLVSYFSVMTSTTVITLTSGLLAAGVAVPTDVLLT